MMKTNSFFFGFFLLMAFFLLLIQCRTDYASGSCEVAGTLTGMSGRVWLYEQGTTAFMAIDSVVPDQDGLFAFRFKPAEDGIFFLKAQSGNRLVFILSPGDHLQVTGSGSGFPDSAVISGNRETEILQAFYRFSAANRRKVDSLQAILDQHKDDSLFYRLTLNLEPVFDQIWESQREYQRQFIRNYPGTLASLLVVNYHFGVRPVLSPSADKEDYLRVDSGLQHTHPENRHGLFYRQWLKNIP